MTRRLVILTMLSVLLIGGVACWLSLPTEPVYNGKKLTDWIYCSKTVRYSHNPDGLWFTRRDEEADSAIRAVGTNMFPVILRMLATTDGKFKTRIISFVNGQSIVKYHLHSADEKADAAASAISVLGEPAKLLAPSIFQLGTDSNAKVRVHALRAIESLIYPDREWARSQHALDHLVSSSFFQDPDAQVRRAAFLSFSLLHPPTIEQCF